MNISVHTQTLHAALLFSSQTFSCQGPGGPLNQYVFGRRPPSENMSCHARFIYVKMFENGDKYPSTIKWYTFNEIQQFIVISMSFVILFPSSSGREGGDEERGRTGGQTDIHSGHLSVVLRAAICLSDFIKVVTEPSHHTTVCV